MTQSKSLDELVDQARALVTKWGDASTARLGQALGTNYNRTAAVVERLEAEGLVSRPDRDGKRNVRDASGHLDHPAYDRGRPWEAVAAGWLARFTKWRRGGHG